MINYGSFRKALMGTAISFSMRKATTILPVHASLERFTNSFSEFGPKDQGYAHFIPSLRTPSMPIRYGFDADQWRPTGAPRDPRSSICVAFGAANGNAAHFRKGVDLILDAAERMPEHRFTIVGLAATDGYKRVPENVQLLGKVPPVELASMFNAHGILLQPSVMEGFPNAVCEAMLCGCLPIVSDITSMPSIVGGEVGAVIRKRDVNELVAAIQRIQSFGAEETDRLRTEARRRIEGFTLDERMRLIEDVLGRS
jgi:glycosyltransferase involved in cell wall biosynthesis